MKLITALIFVLLLPSLGFAQQAAPRNSNTFGRWEFEAKNGMRGSVVIQGGFCHYTLISSFSSMQTGCGTLWSPEHNTLIIYPAVYQGGKIARSFTVPDYQASQGPAMAYSVGDSSVSFQMTRFGRNWMSGHLLGANDHVTVTLRRH